MPNKKISELPDATLPIVAGVKFEAVQGGVNVKVDADDMPGSGIVQTIVAGTNVSVDSTDPANPIVSSTGGTSIPYGETSGTNTYTATTTPTTTDYTTAGALWHIKIKSASTGASTLNIDGVGAKKIMIRPTTQAGSGDLVDEQEYILAYDAALDGAAGAFLLTGSDPAIPSAGLIGNLLYLYNNFV